MDRSPRRRALQEVHHATAALLPFARTGDILGSYIPSVRRVKAPIGPDGAVKGRQAIRAFFESGLDSLFKPGTYEFTMDTLQVADDVAYIVWHANCASADIVFGTDTFLIRDGKVAVQTFAAKIEAKMHN